MKYSRRLEIFEEVRAEYSVFLTSVLWKLTGDRELFTEALQYARLGIWQHVEKLRGPGVQSYIYRIALSSNSKAWRHRIRSNGHFESEALELFGDGTDPLDKREMTEQVRRAITQLSHRQGRAIVMRYFEQQDYQAIAETLHCTKAGARSHVSKALAALKRKLATTVPEK